MMNIINQNISKSIKSIKENLTKAVVKGKKIFIDNVVIESSQNGSYKVSLNGRDVHLQENNRKEIKEIVDKVSKMQKNKYNMIKWFSVFSANYRKQILINDLIAKSLSDDEIISMFVLDKLNSNIKNIKFERKDGVNVFKLEDIKLFHIPGQDAKKTGLSLIVSGKDCFVEVSPESPKILYDKTEALCQKVYKIKNQNNR